jgi:uncharacterized damage-inducible protein DinB
VTRETVEYLARALDATVAVAQTFPADGYDFWPTPESMTVGEQIDHMADCVQEFFTPMAGKIGRPLPAIESADTPANRLASVAAWANEVLCQMPEETWTELFRYPDGYEMTPLRAVLTAIEHDAHHRGQLIVALRLLGIEPPKRWAD